MATTECTFRTLGTMKLFCSVQINLFPFIPSLIGQLFPKYVQQTLRNEGVNNVHITKNVWDASDCRNVANKINTISNKYLAY